MVAAKEEIERIQKEIQYLSSEITDESIDRKCREELSEEDYAEISILQKRLKVILIAFFWSIKANNILIRPMVPRPSGREADQK